MLKYLAIFIAAGFLVAGTAVTAIAGSACCAVPASAVVAPGAEAKLAQVKITQLKFAAEGIFCADCVTHIEARLKQVKGFQSVKVDVPTGHGVVTFDPALTNKAEILKAINNTGYKAKWL